MNATITFLVKFAYFTDSRTIPPFASAHTLCASQDGPRNSNYMRTVPHNSKAAVYAYAGRDTLAGVIKIQKEIWG